MLITALYNFLVVIRVLYDISQCTERHSAEYKWCKLPPGLVCRQSQTISDIICISRCLTSPKLLWRHYSSPAFCSAKTIHRRPLALRQIILVWSQFLCSRQVAQPMLKLHNACCTSQHLNGTAHHNKRFLFISIYSGGTANLENKVLQIPHTFSYTICK